MLQIVTNSESILNTEQRLAYNRILASVSGPVVEVFFLDAPGGTGKTFLLNLVLAKLRYDGHIALAVASSGIAATLLEGGRTAHSTFKLPLNICNDQTAVCNISKQSATAKLLQKCALIVWDESTMSHKTSAEALDRTLKDFRENRALMGGVTVLFAGDFRQTLPIIPRGTRADEINACLKRSYIWSEVVKISLSVNMRALLCGDNNLTEFSNTLLKLGNGDLPERERKVSVDNPQLCVLINDLNELVESVYPGIGDLPEKPLSWFRERAILASTNEAVNYINEYILDKFEAPSRTYKSIDTVVDPQETIQYPVEFLNSLNPSGIPIHQLKLKIGAPIILLRNLNPPNLCNGTRLQVNILKNFVIEATVLTGCATGEKVIIPRIPMIPSDVPFQFKRLQFPVRVCFAMTINKAQGQTLKVGGVDLRGECFAHGQLYVACSRVSSGRQLYLLAPGARTANIVYKEALS